MPIGPSHGSRGGGGGGRSFGGGGGFSFGGGGSRHRSSSRHDSGTSLGGAIIGGLIYSAFANRRRRHFNNRYGYDPSPDEINSMPHRKAPTIFLVLSIIVAFFSVITMSIRSSAVKRVESLNNTISIMKTDYDDYYKPMIDNATEGGTDGFYKTTASFRNSQGIVSKFLSYGDNPQTPGVYLDFQKDGISYYFIVYEFKDAHNVTCKGTTYTQFSANEYQMLNGEIDIAYYFENDKVQYTMNTSYRLDDCAEYKYYQDMLESNKDSTKTYLITFIVEILIVALLVTLYVLKLKKYKKLVKQDEDLLFQKRQAETQKAQAEAQEAELDTKRKNRFCQYCGSQIDENTNVCSGCGARATEDSMQTD